MIIVRLMGGMGNQMFQYALGRALARRRGAELKLDLSFLLDRTPRANFTFRDYDLDIFNLKPEFAKGTESYVDNQVSKRGRLAAFAHRLKARLWPYRYRVVQEQYYHFDPAILDTPDQSYLIGFWQTPKYFEESEAEIRREFSFKRDLSGPAKEVSRKIRAVNSVCVNVRRADYVTNPEANKFHGVCGVDYYHRAEQMMAVKTEEPHFFIFSDDIAWCEKNLAFDGPMTFVSHDCAGDKFGFYLQLMRQCRHFIIPNSSFAWWAAWMNNDTNKIVIAPRNWFVDRSINTSDLTPTNWIRI